MCYVQRGDTLIVMLGGGDKSTQKADIKQAIALARIRASIPLPVCAPRWACNCPPGLRIHRSALVQILDCSLASACLSASRQTTVCTPILMPGRTKV